LNKSNNINRKIILNRKTKNYLIGYSFIAPNFIGFLVFTLIPILASLALSFCEWNGSTNISFIGLENYKHMINNETFRISFLNTLYFSVFNIPLTMICALIVAVVLNNPLKGVNIFRAVYFFPYVCSIVAITAVWNMLFNPDIGPVNYFLSQLGFRNLPRWSVSTKWAMPTVIMASIWKRSGYYMVIYLAGLQGIPNYLYEAAKIDGASTWQRFTKITIPMLTPTTFFVSIMVTIRSFQIFDLVYVMTEGGPGRATNVLSLNIYRSAFIDFEFGYASALATVLFIIVAGITIIQFRNQNKWVNYM
jgi:multiple sugar transport system permease protein